MTGRDGIFNPWLRFTLLAGTAVAAAFWFLRYLEWAFSHSATLGMASRISESRLANHQAWMFLCLFFALEVFSSVIAGFAWEFPGIGSAWLRFSARYGLAFALSILAAGRSYVCDLGWLT